MSRKPTDYSKIMKLLQELHTSYPNYNMGRHISTALADYGDFWGITDKEMLFALTKYKSQLDMDVPHTNDEDEVREIIQAGMDLANILKEEDNGEY